MKNKLIFTTMATAIVVSHSSFLYGSDKNTKGFTTFQASDIGEPRDLKISELVESFDLIHFDNRDEALFKVRLISVSDNYICVRQNSGHPVKLFDRKGKFIGDVGGIGQGPGEYNSIYDVLVDEESKSIYIAPFAHGNILRYDFDGKFVEEIELTQKTKKPKLFIQPKGNLSILNLCFKDRDTHKFVLANVQLKNKKVDYLYRESLAANMQNEKKENVGFNTEYWSWRNVPQFSFSSTQTDTIFHYDAQTNDITPRYRIQKDKEYESAYFSMIELPNHLFSYVYMGRSMQRVLFDKRTGQGEQVSFVNDYLGNMPINVTFQDGYAYTTMEPEGLMMKIEEHLESGKCPDDQKEKLQKLADSLNPNDNNVLLVGKLKR